MIAVDSNLLIYAHREDSEWHAETLAALTALAEGTRRWAIPWPCVHEFIAITTHPGVYVPPTPLPVAFEAMRVWLASPACRAIGEGPDYLLLLEELALKGKARGPRIHDARIAAICVQNGVTELWSADRDLSRFQQLRIVNPLLRRPRRGV
jgi:toxin-antitoxin system PIN domain toxin